MREELDVIPARVAALHASACTKRQWRPLCEVLGREYDVMLPELGGYESISLPIRSGGPGLARRAAPVIEAIEGHGQPIHLVGHSFGGAVAIKIALMRPDLVRSLTVYEPAVFGLVRDSSSEADRRCFRRFQAVGSRLTAAVATGAPDVGMQHFMDFWNGAGAWAALAPGQKAGFSGRAASVMRDFIDGAYEQAALADLRRLTMRTLILSGTRSPEIARRICHRLARTIPNAAHEVLSGAGHMAPVTEAGRVNARIASHLGTMTRHVETRYAA